MIDVFCSKLKSFQGNLFCSSCKVWTIPEKMSAVESSYDQNSHLWQWVKFWKIFDFSKKSKILEKKSNFEKKQNFAKTLRRPSAASLCRMKILQCSFFEELSILCGWNKLKLHRVFYTAHHVSNLPSKNPFWYGFRIVICNTADKQKIEFLRIFCSIRNILSKTYRMRSIRVSYDQSSPF